LITIISGSEDSAEVVLAFPFVLPEVFALFPVGLRVPPLAAFGEEVLFLAALGLEEDYLDDPLLDFFFGADVFFLPEDEDEDFLALFADTAVVGVLFAVGDLAVRAADADTAINRDKSTLKIAAHADFFTLKTPLLIKSIYLNVKNPLGG